MMKKHYLLVLFLSLFIMVSRSQSPCANIPFNLGNDTTLVCSGTVELSAPSGMDNYVWSNGEIGQNITVTQSGIYTCNGAQLGTTNFVTNGDFSAGNTGFQSDYIVGTGGSYGQLSNEGTFAVNTNSSLVHNNFANCYDHTSGSGNMLIVNGASALNEIIWEQTVTVQPNTDYQLSFWGMSVTPANPGELQFSINGAQVGNILTLPGTVCTWDQFYINWNSGTATSVVLAITNQNTQVSGNDFAIDDINFSTVCLYSDDIVVTIPPVPQITLPTTQDVCKGENIQLTASSNDGIVDYSWNGGQLTGATVTVSPTSNQIYTVVGTTADGCESDPKTVVVVVRPFPVVTMVGQDTICSNGDVVVSASSSIANSTFEWVLDHSTNDSLTISLSSSDDIIVDVTSPFGCMTKDTFHVEVIDALDLTITGNPVLCDVDKSLLYVTSNHSNTNYVWLPSNMHSNVIQVTIVDTGWVFVEGTHPVCGVTRDSVLIQAGQIPVVQAPQNDTLCLGDFTEANANVDIKGAIVHWLPIQETGLSQVLEPQVTTTYYVQAQNGNCISDLDSFVVVVNPICDLQVPNVFTPNDDGVNDAFHLVQSNGIKSINCIILNRWGNFIIEFNQPDFQWNGTSSSNNQVDDGVYFYKIEATLLNGEMIKKHGYVHLLR